MVQRDASLSVSPGVWRWVRSGVGDKVGRWWAVVVISQWMIRVTAGEIGVAVGDASGTRQIWRARAS